jgi:hypothetical protein
MTYRISTLSSVTITRSIKSSINLRFCSKLAFISPVWTRLQKSSIPMARLATSSWRSACAQSCCSCSANARPRCSNSRRRRSYSGNGMISCKYASVRRSSCCLKLSRPLRRLAWRCCSCWGSQCPPCARSSALVSSAGCVSTWHKSAHTSSSSCPAGAKREGQCLYPDATAFLDFCEQT